MKPIMFVFMGGQGSGKGTFANLMLKQHNYKYIEVGDILRKMPEDSPLRQKMSRGELVADEDLFPIMTEQLSTDQDVIMDGFPRSLPQAKWLIEKYTDKFDIKILFLNISEQTMFAHIKKRLREGGGRKDDADDNIVKKRIAAFKSTTMPAVQWLQSAPGIIFYDLKLPSDDVDINFAYIMKNIN